MSNKKAVGRPKLKLSELKQTMSFKLSPKTIKYLKSQKRASSMIIEKAIKLYIKHEQDLRKL